MPPDPEGPRPDRESTPGSPALHGGELNAAIARGVVRICRSVAGRGPSKARAFFRGNVYVIVFEETQTRAEHSLIATDQSDSVLSLRRDLQTAMRAQLIPLVEELTGCHVTAFLSANHLAPDVSLEAFILDAPLDGGCQDT